MPDLNPVSVEARIRAAADSISANLPVMDEAYRRWKKAQRDYDRARAKAFLEASGSIPERNARVELATSEARENAEIAEAAWQYANRRWKAAQAELDAMRSIGASVRQAYGAQV